MEQGWIGVDLDGTLATMAGVRWSEGYIGEPVPLMLDRVKIWLNRGMNVKLVTARAAVPEQIPHIRRWLDIYGLAAVQITCQKDPGMIELWDDRVVTVESNTGRVLTERRKYEKV